MSADIMFTDLHAVVTLINVSSYIVKTTKFGVDKLGFCLNVYKK